MEHHEPTKAYVALRTLEGRPNTEIIRCLNLLLARELWTSMAADLALGFPNFLPSRSSRRDLAPGWLRTPAH